MHTVYCTTIYNFDIFKNAIFYQLARSKNLKSVEKNCSNYAWMVLIFLTYVEIFAQHNNFQFSKF